MRLLYLIDGMASNINGQCAGNTSNTLTFANRRKISPSTTDKTILTRKCLTSVTVRISIYNIYSRCIYIYMHTCLDSILPYHTTSYHKVMGNDYKQHKSIIQFLNPVVKEGWYTSKIKVIIVTIQLYTCRLQCCTSG